MRAQIAYRLGDYATLERYRIGGYPIAPGRASFSLSGQTVLPRLPDSLAGERHDDSDAVALFSGVNEQDFAAAQWCQPNMSSRAYRNGGVLVPSEVEVISRY